MSEKSDGVPKIYKSEQCFLTYILRPLFKEKKKKKLPEGCFKFTKFNKYKQKTWYKFKCS